MTREEVLAFSEKGFSQTIADVLNLFFSAGLSGWNVDFCVGRNPVKLVPMNYRIWISEMWHNQQGNFRWLAQQLQNQISGSRKTLTDWGNIAVRIGVLFAMFGELMRQQVTDFEHPMDVAVMGGDFSGPMAVWYAREMGLPIGTIVCGCDDNGALWDLLYHGQIHLDTIQGGTCTTNDEVVLPDLERLIFGVLGFEENQKFVDCCEKGKTYIAGPHGTEQLRTGLFSAVVSRTRMDGIIRSTGRPNEEWLDPAGALAYGGLQDFRAKAGEAGPALILSEGSPSSAAESIARALELPVSDFLDRLKKRQG